MELKQLTNAIHNSENETWEKKEDEGKVTAILIEQRFTDDLETLKNCIYNFSILLIFTRYTDGLSKEIEFFLGLDWMRTSHYSTSDEDRMNVSVICTE